MTEAKIFNGDQDDVNPWEFIEILGNFDEN